MNTLHITSGEYFNTYFEKHYGKKGVPFNEAMMTGKTCFDPFSDPFIRFRAEQHGVLEEVYREKLALFLDAIKTLSSYDEICLWFGADTFCQLNLLTVLAYLEQVNYKGIVYTVLIDDETCLIKREKTPVCLSGYSALYESILVKRTPAVCRDETMKTAVELYFDYLSDEGALAKIVKESVGASKRELVQKLILYSKDYGLSDLQALALIEKYKR